MSSKKIDGFILGIAEATNALIARRFEEGVDVALRTLTQNLDVTSASVYVTFKDENANQLASLKYDSTKEENPQRIANNQKIFFTEFEMLYSHLSNGELFEMLQSKAQKQFRKHLETDNTLSVVVIPIMVTKELWGALVLSNTVEEKEWSESEKALLLSLANTMGAAIERERLECSLEATVKKRTADLQDSKLRFELALEGTQNGIWDWQPQEHKIFWSENMYKNLGYEPEDLPDLIDGFDDLIHPEERKESRQKFDNYLNNGVPYMMEYRLKRKDGSYRWFKSTCKAVWDENGRPIRVVGCHEDIHQRKVYTKLLEEQEERFRSVIRDDPSALFLVNRLGSILLFSHRVKEVFGYSEKELAKLKLVDLLPSNEASVHENYIETFFEKPYAGALEEGFEVKGKRKNGQLFLAEVGLSPVSIGGETQVIVVVTDITEKREAEAKLQETYRKMDNLISNMPGIVYQCKNDENWTMDYISPACQQITGYKQKSFYGNPSEVTYAGLIIAEDRDDVWEQVQESITNKVPFRINYRIKDKAGVQKWIWEQGVGVYDENGDCTGLEGCIFDITPVVRNQERINHAIQVTENRERRRIAADLHDGVQQILGVSSLNLKNIQEEIKNISGDAQEHYKKSIYYLEQGIRESRNIAHRLMPVELQQLGLDRAIQQLLDQLKSNLGIEIYYFNNAQKDLSQDIDFSLYRVLQECFNNISKYAQASKVSVQIVSNDTDVQMIVEDNGVGFDRNKIDLYNNGYGLNSMKSRISSLSGRLVVDSKPGRGTSIVVWLPKRTVFNE